MTKVQVFKPNHRYILTKDYHDEVFPWRKDAKAGDILIFCYENLGRAHFRQELLDKEGLRQPVVMSAHKAFRLVEEVSDESL